MKPNKRYQDGGKKPGTASRQDSLNAYNAAVELLQALEGRGYDINTNPTEEDLAGETSIQDFVRYLKGEFTQEEKNRWDVESQYEPMKMNVIGASDDGSSVPIPVVQDDIYKYYGILDRSEKDGVIRAREKTIGVINPGLPLAYYDRKIEPQGFMQAYGRGDVVELPYYDPIAVKPYDMLTEEEKAERERKYGSKEAMLPVKNKITKTVRAQQPPAPQTQRPAAIALRRMFPNPPAQNQITATDDRQLQEMLLDERKKGRESVRIMKSDQQMDTGLAPNYDVFWDDSRKQWVRRDISQEEKDRYRQEHRVFRSSMSF